MFCDFILFRPLRSVSVLMVSIPLISSDVFGTFKVTFRNLKQSQVDEVDSGD